MQSVLPAVYPILKEAYSLDFGQIGLITFANQATASLLQPVIGTFTDRRPKPYSLAIGMAFTLVGLLADTTSIEFVYKVCSFLPAIGLLTWFLPDVKASGLRPRA